MLKIFYSKGLYHRGEKQEKHKSQCCQGKNRQDKLEAFCEFFHKQKS
jgi:hypothetical protein